MNDCILKDARKCRRKQKRAFHRLFDDMNIRCSEVPTQYLTICNAGLVTGLRIEELKDIIQNVTSEYDLIMIPGKSYCFINCQKKEDAANLYDRIHGKTILDGHKTPLYLSYCETVPNVDNSAWISEPPPGCKIIKDFVTSEEEKMLIENIDWNNEEVSPSLKHRRVKHFGYEFRYDNNKVDTNNPISPIPESYQFLQELFRKHNCAAYSFDQLTINYYLPGQGIPPHIDTHSVFEDTILSLSLGSACIMDFKRDDRKIHILLPSRSLLIMSGETRYAWSHGISPRHNDMIKKEDGITSQPRDIRISFTFRKVRSGDCECTYSEYCDRNKNRIDSIDNKAAMQLEQCYVHNVYEEISNHFSETRHQPWPNVVKFIESLEKGSIILDVGCGNGKYLNKHHDFFKIGCDRSSGLIEICNKKDCEILSSDCLFLPFKDNSVDAAISIAVIHHLCTHERRKQAIAEIIRILRPNGKCLIYVWAKEQNWNSTESTYLKYNTSRNKDHETESFHKIEEQHLTLPVHRNRTEFTHSDMLVPWKRKTGGKFLRYYHIFEEGELLKLCADIDFVNVENVYYDQGNWCIILQKKQ